MIFIRIANQENIAEWATAEDYQGAQSKSLKSRTSFLLARATMRALLAEATGQRDWQLYTEENGKTYVLNGPHISISHSQDLVACAVCEYAPIGIDIEIQKPRDFERLASYAFGPNERQAVAVEGASAFYRIWSIREAMAKAKGESVISNMDGTDCMFDQWQIYDRVIEGNYSFAFAVQSCDNLTSNEKLGVNLTSRFRRSTSATI